MHADSIIRDKKVAKESEKYHSVVGTRDGEAFIRKFQSVDNCGADDAEAASMKALVTAWNEFTKFSDIMPADMRDFEYAIHACQNIIASRIVARVFPGWRNANEGR